MASHRKMVKSRYGNKKGARKNKLGSPWRNPRYGNMLRSDGRDGIARQVYVALKYSEYFEHNAVIGTPVGDKFRINGMHQPRLSGTGHSCMGFNSLAQLYEQYKVYGLKWKITFVNRNATQQDGNPSTWITNPQEMIMCCVFPETNTLAYQNINSAVEATGSKHGILSRDKTQLTLSGYIDVQRLLGYSKEQFGDHANQATVSGDPIEYVALSVLAQCPDDNSRINYSYHIDFTYYGKFFDKKKQLSNPVLPPP